jgi:hypothetical protein
MDSSLIFFFEFIHNFEAYEPFNHQSLGIGDLKESVIPWTAGFVHRRPHTAKGRVLIPPIICRPLECPAAPPFIEVPLDSR